VYFNRGPHGGWQSFKPSESATIATALDALGYRTALIGKYLNGHAGDGLYVPPGWERWFAFAQANGDYYDYRILDNANGLQELSFGTEPRDYSTDVLRRKAAAFIRGTPTGTPFFLMVTPYAPHGPPIAPLEEGLAQHEPNRMLGRFTARDGPPTLRQGNVSVSTGRFRGPWFVLLRPIQQRRGGCDAVRHADLSGRCARATGRAP
jgi:arylsulfatase A-like enzyme